MGTDKHIRSEKRLRGSFERLNNLIVLLDVGEEGEHLDDILLRDIGGTLARNLTMKGEFANAVSDMLDELVDSAATMLDHSVAIFHRTLDVEGPPVQVLCRLTHPLRLRDAEGHPVRFVWVLLSHEETHPSIDAAVEFSALMADPEFAEACLDAKTAEQIDEAYQDALDREVHFAAHIPAELARAGGFMRGVVNDVRRRKPHYLSDFTDGISSKSVGAILFLYFACLAPTLAFGVLASELTGGQMGPIEMIVATAISGVLYGLFSGQPLTILGGIAPVIILIQVIYQGCLRLEIPFLPSLAWVGLWTMVFLLLTAAFELCRLIRFFTRFTDDTFAALISLIFIAEAVKPLIRMFNGQGNPAAAWMSLALALGTFYIALNLSRFRHSPYLSHTVREFLADFGATIAIGTMTAIALLNHNVVLPALKVPLETISTTSGRAWFVNPFEAPTWVWGAAAGPALVVTILLYLDQNITVRLVNSPDNRLKKGAGYHLDIAIVGLLVGICSLFGLPWMVAATVRSLNHVRSLATVEVDKSGKERIASVLENRVTNIVVNLLMGLTVFLLPLVSKIPLSVLFGLFLFMGVASMSGNQFFERIRLWALEPSRYPPTYYLRAVPTKTVHKYTAIQLFCLVFLWALKVSLLSILFPVFIAALVPVRMWLERLFKKEHLALLDSEEVPEQEEDRFV
jgi:mannitol/fructose-specific phosphotransferase system IIA component (Ntr-type)